MMTNKPDWKTAPADAQFYHFGGFRKHENGEYFCWHRGNWHRSRRYEDINIHKWRFDFEMRPESSTPEWTGQGLPPVGTVCDMYWGGCFHAEVEIIQYRRGANQVVFWNKDKDHVDTADMPTASFEPIKSDRDKWIDEEIEKAGCLWDNHAVRTGLGRIYDDGLAKLP